MVFNLLPSPHYLKAPIVIADSEVSSLEVKAPANDEAYGHYGDDNYQLKNLEANEGAYCY